MTIATDVCAACGRARGSAPLCTACRQPLIGAALGPDQRYRVNALATRDSGACVWRGTDLLQRRRCVLQTYRPADLTERQVLTSGGSRVLMLRNPRLPEPIEVFEEQEGDLFVLVLAASEAPSLRDLIAARGPMPYDAACAVGIQIAEAVEFLAAQDLVHEGLSPDTIAVSEQLSAALMTVTIPRMSREHVDGEQRGPYQAPELVAGWPYGQPIAVYGLSSTLLFGLLGRDPVAGPEVVSRELQRSGVPPLLADLLTSSRLVDPARRPGLHDLQAALRAGVPRSQPRPEVADATTVHGGLRTLDQSDAMTLPAGTTGQMPGHDEASTLVGEGTSMQHRPELTDTARDDLIQMAQQVEQRGDLYGALDLYRRAAELAPPNSDLSYQLLERAASVEARLVAAQGPPSGRATVMSPGVPPPVVPQRQGGGLRWLMVLLACLAIAGVIALTGRWLWPQIQGSPSTANEVPPPPTPAAVLVAPPANAPPVRTDLSGLMTAADAARQAGDFERAMDMLQRLKGMSPPPDGIDDRLYQTHVAYGQKLLERGEHDASQAQFVAALAIRPDGREALDGQRLVQQVRNWDQMEAQWQKDPDAALAAAKANFAIDPDWRGTRQKLYALLISRAEGQWQRGERDTARATLEEARTVDASAGDADERMQRWFSTPAPLIAPTSTPAALLPAPGTDVALAEHSRRTS